MKNLLVVTLLILVALTSFAEQNKREQADTMSSVEVNEVINNIANAIESTYLYAEKPEALSKALLSLRKHSNHRRNISTQRFIADTRTLLVETSGDRYVDVFRYELPSVAKLPHTSQFTKPITSELQSEKIGYIKFNGDLKLANSNELLANAMSAIKGAEALVIDLRHADETNLKTIELFLSYFLEQDTTIGKVVISKETIELKTLAIDTQNQFTNNFPIYIVNSAFVSGSWELFGYTLKNKNKALLIGEDTMGQTKLTTQIKVHEKIILKLPYAIITDPLTNESWHSGVSADIHIESDKALEKAFQEARASLSH